MRYAKSKMRRIVELVIVLALVALGWCVPTWATIQVGPSIVRPVVRAGTPVDFQLTVLNGDEVAREFEVTVTNMTAAPQGFPVEAPADDPHGCADWLTISPMKFSLDPNSGRRLQCQLRAPRGAAGGYYALIMVRSPSPEPRGPLAPGSGAISMAQSFGTAVLAVVPGRRFNVRLRPQGTRLGLVPPSAQEPGGWVVEALVRNEGNIHAKVEGKCELRSGTGAVIARTPMDAGSATILPAANRIFRARGPRRLSDGVYVVRSEFVVPGTRIRAVASQPFAVKEGEVSAVEDTADIKALMESLRPTVDFSSPELTISASPGSRTSRAVTLINLSKEPLDLSLACCEWQLSEDGIDEFPDTAPVHNRSAVEWLSVTPQRVTLRPSGRVGVRISATVPRESHGEYFDQSVQTAARFVTCLL